jgi:hypothetical protein
VRRALLKNRRLCVIHYSVQSTARLESPYFEFPVGPLELSLKPDTYEVTLENILHSLDARLRLRQRSASRHDPDGV